MATTKKTSLKIFLLAAALIVMNGCSAQKRAERHVRKAVALCPELVQVKAHPIDTVLTVGPWADCAAMPMPHAGETLYASTPHGTVVVSKQKSDSVLRIGFVASPQQVRYRDTIRYSQVSASPRPAPESGPKSGWSVIGMLLLGALSGMLLLLVVALKAKQRE